MCIYTYIIIKKLIYQSIYAIHDVVLWLFPWLQPAISVLIIHSSISHHCKMWSVFFFSQLPTIYNNSNPLLFSSLSLCLFSLFQFDLRICLSLKLLHLHLVTHLLRILLREFSWSPNPRPTNFSRSSSTPQSSTLITSRVGCGLHRCGAVCSWAHLIKYSLNKKCLRSLGVWWMLGTVEDTMCFSEYYFYYTH